MNKYSEDKAVEQPAIAREGSPGRKERQALDRTDVACYVPTGTRMKFFTNHEIDYNVEMRCKRETYQTENPSG